MAKGLIERSTLTAIADAIRAKTGSSGQMLPSEMAGLIEGISGGTVLKGWVQPTTSQGATLSLGVELPEADNFALVIYAATGNDYVGKCYNTVILLHHGGQFLYNMYGAYLGSSAANFYGTALYESDAEKFTVDHATGTITSTLSTTSYSFYTPKTYYHWLYIAG